MVFIQKHITQLYRQLGRPSEKYIRLFLLFNCNNVQPSLIKFSNCWVTCCKTVSQFMSRNENTDSSETAEIYHPNEDMDKAQRLMLAWLQKAQITENRHRQSNSALCHITLVLCLPSSKALQPWKGNGINLLDWWSSEQPGLVEMGWALRSLSAQTIPWFYG